MTVPVCPGLAPVANLPALIGTRSLEMNLDFSFSEENTMLVNAVGEAMKPWANERKTGLG
jgi:hypothetical protein